MSTLSDKAFKLATDTGISCEDAKRLLWILKDFEINPNTAKSALTFLNSLEKTKGNEVNSIKLSDGTEIKGTEDQIFSIMKRLGYSKQEIDSNYYESSSKGRILISDMDTQHIKNAFLKELKYCVDLQRNLDLDDFIEKFHIIYDDESHESYITTDKCNKLYSELVRRLDAGEI